MLNAEQKKESLSRAAKSLSNEIQKMKFSKGPRYKNLPFKIFTNIFSAELTDKERLQLVEDICYKLMHAPIFFESAIPTLELSPLFGLSTNAELQHFEGSPLWHACSKEAFECIRVIAKQAGTINSKSEWECYTELQELIEASPTLSSSTKPKLIAYINTVLRELVDPIDYETIPLTASLPDIHSKDDQNHATSSYVQAIIKLTNRDEDCFKIPELPAVPLKNIYQVTFPSSAPKSQTHHYGCLEPDVSADSFKPLGYEGGAIYLDKDDPDFQLPGDEEAKEIIARDNKRRAEALEEAYEYEEAAKRQCI